MQNLQVNLTSFSQDFGSVGRFRYDDPSQFSLKIVAFGMEQPILVGR